MKYEKFEGSLGEFLEQYAAGVKFYTKDGGHGYLIETDYFCSLTTLYKSGVYIEKEEVWTDHLPVLCWVSDSDSFKWRLIGAVSEYADGYYFVEEYGYNYAYAKPMTQEEIDKLTWKGVAK